MQWGHTAAFRGVSGTKYEVEHVLEWNVVTSFFEWIDKKKGNTFPNPDPRQVDAAGTPMMMKFCPYFKILWEGSGIQPFSIKNGPLLGPLAHIAYAYPSAVKYTDEFVLLEDDINAPAKSEVSQTQTPLFCCAKTCIRATDVESEGDRTHL
jgi:hypothetical protein